MALMKFCTGRVRLTDETGIDRISSPQFPWNKASGQFQNKNAGAFASRLPLLYSRANR